MPTHHHSLMPTGNGAPNGVASGAAHAAAPIPAAVAPHLLVGDPNGKVRAELRTLRSAGAWAAGQLLPVVISRIQTVLLILERQSKTLSHTA